MYKKRPHALWPIIGIIGFFRGYTWFPAGCFPEGAGSTASLGWNLIYLTHGAPELLGQQDAGRKGKT
jgi:hypothetical protein